MRWVLAVLLGTLAGSALTRAYTHATSCATSAWRLELVSSSEPDESIWPATAYLQTSGPPIRFQADGTDAKIDYLAGGMW